MNSTEPLIEIATKLKNQGNAFTPNYLWLLLEKASLRFASSSRPTNVLIDAIDELQDEDRFHFLQVFKNLVGTISTY